MKKNKTIITILVAIIISATLTACGATTSETLARNLDNSLTNFVYTVSSMDWIEKETIDNLANNTSTYASSTSAYSTQNMQNQNTNNVVKSNMNTNVQLHNNNNNLSTNNLNTNDNFMVNYNTDNLIAKVNDIQNQINSLIEQRSALMLYINEIYNGNVNLASSDISAINAYMNIIRDNTGYMNSNKGMVRNQLNRASDTYTGNNNRNLINAYIIRANEAIETRLTKLESSVEAINSILQIIENKLSPNSTFYNNSLANNLTNNTNINTNKDLNSNSNNTNTNTSNNLNSNLNNTNTNTSNNLNNNLNNTTLNSRNNSSNNQNLDNNTTNNLNTKQNSITNNNITNTNNSSSIKLNNNTNLGTADYSIDNGNKLINSNVPNNASGRLINNIPYAKNNTNNDVQNNYSLLNLRNENQINNENRTNDNLAITNTNQTLNAKNNTSDLNNKAINNTQNNKITNTTNNQKNSVNGFHQDKNTIPYTQAIENAKIKNSSNTSQNQPIANNTSNTNVLRGNPTPSFNTSIAPKTNNNMRTNTLRTSSDAGLFYNQNIIALNQPDII